jgi:hypothetical protein
MMRIHNALVATLFFLIASSSNASIVNEVPVISKKITNFFKKSVDDIPAPGKSSTPLKDSTNSAPSDGGEFAKKLLGDAGPYNANAAVQLGKCVNNKLNSDPKISAKEAEQFCRRSFYNCVSQNKNSIGFDDAKCASAVNEGRPYATDLVTPYSK